jgi:hypothetical protein
MGGLDARLTIEESIPNLVAKVNAQRSKAGLQYLDYLWPNRPLVSPACRDARETATQSDSTPAGAK